MMRLAKVGNAYKKPDPMEREDEDTDGMKLEPDELIRLLIEHPDITLEAVEDGMEMEREHTECPCIRAKITMDHLLEDPQYYEKLEKMEGEEDEKDE
jgi:hypothetical protein